MLSKRILFLSNQENGQTKDMEIFISLKYSMTVFCLEIGVDFNYWKIKGKNFTEIREGRSWFLK